LLVDRAGFTPAEAIRAGTTVNAAALGRQQQEGAIAPGRLANFLVVAADPLREIGNLRTILFTVKRGRRYDRSEFRPISPHEMPDDD
jgi:imidazolonepropionase-like amidohydrolase